MKKSFSGFALFLSTAVLIFSTAAFGQEEYRTEVAAEYVNMDQGSDMEASAIGVLGEFFFEPVNTAGHPYAEASFLERIGSVNVGIANMDVEIASVDGDGPMFIAGVTLAKPDFPLAFQLQYAKTDVDFDDVDASLESNDYELRVGYFFLPALLAGIEYNYVKTDIEAPGETFTDKTKDYGAFAKYFHELEQGAGLNVEGSLGQSRTDDGAETLKNTEVAVSADYYFNRSVSAGAGIGTSSGDNEGAEGNTYGVRARYFFTPQFSIAASYDKFDAGNDNGEDEKTLDLFLSARF